MCACGFEGEPPSRPPTPRRSAAVRRLGDEGLTDPSEFADEPVSTLVLHVNREVIHHGAEIALLRDLYRAI